MDATEFELPKDPLVCYFSNPFDSQLMRQMLSNIEGSLGRGCPSSIRSLL
jgi:hypothetical protein